MNVVVVRRHVARIVLAALAASSAAHAQAGDLDRARALYDEAGELERHGKWPAAVEKLRAAIKIRETPHLHYALGWALENDDKLLEARAEYEAAERTARGTPGGDEVESLARGRRTELLAKTPSVRVIVPEARKRARIVVDGRETRVQGDGAVVAVNPGARVVRVENVGSAPIERIVYVARGETGTVDLTSDLATPARGGRDAAELRDAAPEAPAVTRRERSDVLPWVLVGGGAALVATSGALFVSSLGDAGERDDAMRAWCAETACSGGNVATLPESSGAAARRQDAEDAASRGNMKQTAAAIVGSVGLVGAVVGGMLFLRHDDRETGTRANTPRLHVGAAPLPGGASASALLRF